MASRFQLSDHGILEAALIGLRWQHTEIESKMAEIRRNLGIRVPRTNSADKAIAEVPAKRTMSTAARKRIAAAQRKRWAAARKAKIAPDKVAPKKRRISAEGMKRIIAATKK